MTITAAYCAASEPEAQRTVLVLGDSLSAAYGMPLAQGWVALARAELAQSHPGVTLINASISGETSGGGLARLPALLEEHKPQLVLIELGANDGLRGYPPGSLRDNLAQMVEQIQKAGGKAILVEINIPPNYGRRYIRAISNSFKQVAHDTSSTLIPFLQLDLGDNKDLLQTDGLHPTAKAQPLIAAHFLPVLRKALDSL